MWNLLAEILDIAPIRTRYRLGFRPGLKVTHLKQIEAQTRIVARWAGSFAWRSRIDCVYMDGKVAKKGDLGWCSYGRLREGRPRTIWINSRVDWFEQADTALHEYAHAFVPYGESHGPMFRLTYLVAWGLYLDVDDKTFRRHARRTIRRYGAWFSWRTELNKVHDQYVAARRQLRT